MSPSRAIAAALAALALAGASPASGAAQSMSPSASTRAEVKSLAETVLTSLGAWDLPKAKAAAERLAEVAPDSSAGKDLLARVRFEDGDYAGAVALYDEIGAQDGEAALARATLKETKGYQWRESANFVFAFPAGKDAVLAPYGLETLEKIHAAMKTDLGWVPPHKIRVEVYNDARALSKVSTLSLESIKTSGTIAICKFNKLMITSPKALVKGYEWQDTLAHEYIHLVVSQMSRNSVPIWIHEGLAKYLESRWRGPAGQALSPASAGLLAQAFKQKKLIPFDRMHPSMALLPSQEDAALAFAEVFTAVEYLHGKGGNALLVKLIEELQKTDRYQVALEKAVGVPFARFYGDWNAYLARREYPREALPLSAEKLKFKDDQTQKPPGAQSASERDEIRFGDFLEIEDAEGRKLAHLGELLRQRKRNGAAVAEFEKAYARVGNRSPALSNRFAQALLEVGDKPKAEQLLVASLKPFPGYARTYNALAEIYLGTGRPQEAERSLLEVIAIDPFDPSPHAALTKIYSDRKDQTRLDREKAVLQILMGRELPTGNDGRIVVRSHPYARVLLNGVDTGRTTPAQLTVPPGSHVVKLVNEERGITREQLVEVSPGEEKTVDLSLDAPAEPPK